MYWSKYMLTLVQKGGPNAESVQHSALLLSVTLLDSRQRGEPLRSMTLRFWKVDPGPGKVVRPAPGPIYNINVLLASGLTEYWPTKSPKLVKYWT